MFRGKAFHHKLRSSDRKQEPWQREARLTNSCGESLPTHQVTISSLSCRNLQRKEERERERETERERERDREREREREGNPSFPCRRTVSAVCGQEQSLSCRTRNVHRAFELLNMHEIGDGHVSFDIGMIFIKMQRATDIMIQCHNGK